MQHIKFWQKIPKLPAYSTVEEYNRLTSYGSEGGAFAPEGELNAYDDATYTRQVSLVKYLQTVRKVTHPMTLVRTAHGDIIGNEIKNGIMWLLGKLENYLYNGNVSLRYGYSAYASGAATAEGYEFDGLKRMIDSTMVIDCNGDPLTEDVLETAANQVIENYGFPTDILIGTKPLADLAKIMFPKERIVVPFKEGQIGVPLNTFASQAGTLAFNPDVFLRRKSVTSASVAQGPSGYTPTAPQGVTINLNAGTSAGQWTLTGNGLGNYYFAVTFGNRFGESAPIVSDVAAVTSATGGVRLQIQNAATVAVAPDFINIYRTMGGGVATGPFYLIASCPALRQGNAEYQNVGGGAGYFEYPAGTDWFDYNLEAAGCHNVYLGELTPQVLMFKQLAPMMKLDLAVIEPAIRWAQLLYGVPQLYATKKWTRIRNVGEATV
jgi:hypothetical protein